MRIWRSHGSEHSYNLVLVGHFRQIEDATSAKRVIEQLSEQVSEEIRTGVLNYDAEDNRFSEELRKLLYAGELHSIGPSELQQFAYDVRVEVIGTNVKLTTDEIDVSAFLKVLIDLGARVEIYSAHEYPDGSSSADA